MADKIYLNSRFGYREDTLANWQAENPILERGEISFVRDGKEGKFIKIGDGVTTWNSLSFAPLPKGEKGAQGEPGPKGDKGDRGNTGATGPQGSMGPKGDKGAKGEQGIQGEKGEKGDKGDPGADGKDAVIDQTYSPDSKNAQSGLAVAEAVSSMVLADITLDETTANVKSVSIEIDNEKADVCSEYLFEIKFVPDVEYVSPALMVCLRTGWANNVLAYSRSSNCSAGATVRAYSFTLRDGKNMYSIYRPLHVSADFNSTATPESTTSFTYDTENSRRSLDMWFQTEHTFPVGTHIRLIGRR